MGYLKVIPLWSDTVFIDLNEIKNSVLVDMATHVPSILQNEDRTEQANNLPDTEEMKNEEGWTIMKRK